MSQKCLLFTYGLLMPGRQPPHTMTNSWPDGIKGVMYDLGDHPIVVQIDSQTKQSDDDHWVEGHTLEIEVAELETLDEFENVDGGDYKRRLVTTREGFVAWVYEFNQAVPPGLTPIKKWGVS